MRALAILTVALVGLSLLLLAAGCRAEGRGGRSDTAEEAMRMDRTMRGGDHGGSTSRYSRSGYDLTPPTPEELRELLKDLTPEQIQVTQRAGTEAPFCGNLLDNEEDGIYVCAVCGLPLFSSEHKFHSGTGWPSFFAPFDPAHVGRREDGSAGMTRTEIFCSRCGAHLGHVFPDGPPPTRERYCLNSAALDFIAAGEEIPPASRPAATETAYFAGGCFWGVEDAFARIPGVLDATSGYQGGHTVNPTYREVCSGTTGHAESVRVTFDPRVVSYEDLVRAFFRLHDPTTLNRQGPDIGAQYRSAIFTVDREQEDTARRVIQELAAAHSFGDRHIVTVVEPAKPFYAAEDYHQDYHARHGGSCTIAP